MIHLPVIPTKFLIVLLLGTFFFHISFNLSKKYSFIYDSRIYENRIKEATYDEYLVCLNSIPNNEKQAFIESTVIFYLNGYMEETYYMIYAMYFIVLSMLVLIAKFKPTLNEN